MLKSLSTFLLVLLCATMLSAQNKRRVLIEEFTNASCPPCAAQNPAFNATVAANLQYLTPIKYQTNWPGYDPMNVQTQSEVGPRVSYYGVTGVPNGRQNGTLEVFPVSAYTAAQIQTAYNNLTPVTMTLSHGLNAAKDSVWVNVSVKSDAALTGNLRLRTLITEEEIVFENAPGSNGEKDFYQIMRKMLPNAAGTETGPFAAGETKNYSFSWKLDYFYDLNQMSAAAFLQNDATKEVLQSERSAPLGLNLTHHGASINSGELFACAPGYSPSFTLTNTGNANLTSAHVRYRYEGGAWVDYPWTGNLAPGASEKVTLTDIVINSGTTTTTLEVTVLNSNLGIQTNFAQGIAIFKIKPLLDAAQALPFGNTFQSAAYPPAGWSTYPATGNDAWKLFTAAGSNSTRSTRCSLYIVPPGVRSFLTTPKVNLANASGPSKLTFDHAYTYFSNADFDSLRVEASIDCGQTWTTLFHDGYLGLATAPLATAAFVPTASQWRANELDISVYNGNDEVQFRFVAESGYGNNLYIDNVNVTNASGIKELPLGEFVLSPNPTRDYAEVRFDLETAQDVNLQVFSADGALVQSKQLGTLASGTNRISLDANMLASGSYRVVLQGSQGIAQTQWIVVK